MFGQSLEESVVKVGLRELCPGLHFDMLTNINQVHPYQTDRQGVFYDGRHICSMDRGVIPEFKVWNEIETAVEISPGDADRAGDAWCVYVEILPTDGFYHDALLKAQRHDDNFTIDERGKVFKWTHLAIRRCRDRVIRVGWRHTFERLLAGKFPGITRHSLGEKFGVDMFKYPVGSPEEVHAALVEE